MTVAVYVGMLTGAIFWGSSADFIGRKWAFNVSLFVCAIATLVAGAAPNWPALGFFIAALGFGGGGNLILDTTVFLEYLPGDKQWWLTLLACWWGFGQAITGFICWGFLGKMRNWLILLVYLSFARPMLTCSRLQCPPSGTATTRTAPRRVHTRTTKAGDMLCSPLAL